MTIGRVVRKVTYQMNRLSDVAKMAVEKLNTLKDEIGDDDRAVVLESISRLKKMKGTSGFKGGFYFSDQFPRDTPLPRRGISSRNYSAPV